MENERNLMRLRMDPSYMPPVVGNMLNGKPKPPKKPHKTEPGATMKLFKSCSTNLICAFCFEINARECQGCHNIAYCSREHQILHWSIHHRDCKPLVSVQMGEVLHNLSLPVEERNFDPYTGMYKATRNLNPKEVVLHIQPIMYVAHNKGLPVPPDSILCLGCNRWYQLSQGYRCSKCKWPVCSERCEVVRTIIINETFLNFCLINLIKNSYSRIQFTRNTSVGFLWTTKYILPTM